MTTFVLLICALIALKLILTKIPKAQNRILVQSEAIITDTIQTHSKTLCIKREQLTLADPYGNVDLAKFHDHLVYFIQNVIVRDLKAKGFRPQFIDTFVTSKKGLENIVAKIYAAVEGEAGKIVTSDLLNVKTGIDYEYFCKRLLEASGWSVLTTPATGDQGADLIATKSGVRVIFQCKFYSQPVGNKAVQEAHTAKAHQRADFAVVVSNATYTDAARQLAQTSGVFLIHHHLLSSMESVLGEQHFPQNAIRGSEDKTFPNKAHSYLQDTQ